MKHEELQYWGFTRTSEGYERTITKPSSLEGYGNYGFRLVIKETENGIVVDENWIFNDKEESKRTFTMKDYKVKSEDDLIPYFKYRFQMYNF